MKVTLFDWIVDGESAKAGLAYGRVNASLQGPLDSLVAVHGQVEGEMPFERIAMLEFPSRKAAEDWYHSPAYQKILPLRTNATECQFIVVDGVA